MAENNVIKLLIADDAVAFRSQIKAVLESTPGLEIVGVAANGRIALKRLETEHVDLLITDIDMPEMDGLTLLKEIRARGIKVTTIVFSALNRQSVDLTMEALALGAVDFIAKPSGKHNSLEVALDQVRQDLVPKIRSLVDRINQARLAKTAPPIEVPEVKPPQTFTRRAKNLETFEPHIVLIASSTGGPQALDEVFGLLPNSSRIPICMVQHMPPIFTKNLAERLQKKCGIETKEAEHNEVIKKGVIYLAPGDYHFSLERHHATVIAKLSQGPKRCSVRPCADYLIESAAEIYGDQSMLFTLTGMGADSCDGAGAVYRANGGVMIQDKESSVVWGMPGSIYQKGYFDRVGTLRDIGTVMGRMIKGVL